VGVQDAVVLAGTVLLVYGVWFTIVHAVRARTSSAPATGKGAVVVDDPVGPTGTVPV
jgi:hypothetical protein